MSPKLPVVRPQDVVKVAEKPGFVLDRQKGSHAVYYRKEDCARIVIPMHASRDIKAGTLKGILLDMGLSVDKFLQLL